MPFEKVNRRILLSYLHGTQNDSFVVCSSSEGELNRGAVVGDSSPSQGNVGSQCLGRPHERTPVILQRTQNYFSGPLQVEGDVLEESAATARIHGCEDEIRIASQIFRGELERFGVLPRCDEYDFLVCSERGQPFACT